MKYEIRGNPNYAAKVIRVRQLQVLEGLDNLRGVPVDGYLALVSKDTPLDSLAVVFPAEAQLSEAFAAENNLHRDSTLNRDPGAVGYLEKHRRIKAIKLRGYVSSALLLPAWEEDMTEGLEFDTINGETISVKYEPPAKGNPNTPKTPKQDKLFGKVAYALPEHIDTAQFLREQHTIPGNTHIIVSQKVHGCLSYRTKILLGDGTTETIGSLVGRDYRGTVIGMVEGRPQPVRVLNTFDNGRNADVWYDIKVAGKRRGKNNRTSSLHVTPNHRLFAPNHELRDNEGYVRADQLSVGDVLWSLDVTKRMPYAVQQILLGKMLGDGSFTSRGGTANVRWGQVSQEYSQYCRDALGYFAVPTMDSVVSGYGSTIFRGASIYHHRVHELFNEWFPEGDKQVPRSAVNLIGPIALAFWYMDDGSLSHHNSQEDRVSLATNGFNEASIDNLLRSLSKFGISGVKYQSKGWRIRLNKDDADVFFHLVAPYIPDSMAYKLPERFRGLTQTVSLPEPESEFYPVTVLSATVSDVSSKRYDLETESGNFVAGGILVHNSSVRVAKVEVERERTWWQKLLRRPAQTYWAWAVGSRKVIKTVSGVEKASSDHWYAEGDIWTKTMAPYEALVPNGFALYGEIYGYVPNSSTPIQKGYTYDAKPGEAKFVAYRVVNHGIDLGDAAAREWCAERGIAFVPKLWEGRKDQFVPEVWTDQRFAETYEAQKAGGVLDYYLEPPIALAKESPVDEGVVVLVPGLAPKWYKCKGSLFYEFESRVLDTAEEVLS